MDKDFIGMSYYLVINLGYAAKDVGGVDRFYDFLKVYNDPANEYYTEVREWGKEQFYRELDIERINHRLKAVKWKKTEWDKINHVNYEIVEDKYRKS